MTAQDLIGKLQTVLGLHLKTGQLTLNLRDGLLESFETRTYARLRRQNPAEWAEEQVEKTRQLTHT